MHHRFQAASLLLLLSASLASCSVQPQSPAPSPETAPAAATSAGEPASVVKPAETPVGLVTTAIPYTPPANPTSSPGEVTAAPSLPAAATAAIAPPASEPEVANTIVVSTMPFHPGGGPGALLALPGQVWTATMFSGLQAWDPQTGRLVQTYDEIDAEMYFDLAYDGRRLWVLASRDDATRADILYGIDLPEGKIAAEIPIMNEGSYGTDPTRLGFSPGKIWVNFGIVNTQSLEYTSLSDGLPSEANFAYDGGGWMWITGSWCHGCQHDLWIVNAENPLAHRDNQNSGVLGTGTLGQPLALAGGKMWLVTVYYSGQPEYFLDAYDLQQTGKPALHIDVTAEMYDHGSVHLAADNQMVWLEAGGTLFYVDNLTGGKVGELNVGEEVEDMSFDGASLWVLCSDAGLLQISLPWSQ